MTFVLITATVVTAAEPVDFDRDVRPILADKCFHCHGPDGEQRRGELRLDLRHDAFADRDGHRVIVPGKPGESVLVRRVLSKDDDERMPPPDAPRQLTRDEAELLERWVREGAEWNEHWAFTPPSRPAKPVVAATGWAKNGIDDFILAQLERAGMSPSPEAERTTLIRRVTFALTGLPPTPDEIDAFLADDSPGAYERVVDRLLASPRYGEHMAGPWLDAARYADTDGYQNDRYRYMWVWRDWVVKAFNDNQPFDEFTIEQLAGDLLPSPTFHQQVATGFGRNHRINSEGGSIPDEWAVEYVVDRVDTVGTIWLGLTLGCARCHDHKYDPVTQREYYQLFAYFNNVPEWGLGPNNGNSPPFVKVPTNWPNLSPQEDRLIEPAPYKLNTTQTSVVRPNPGGPETVMVMQERAERRPTYRLDRGQYDHPDESEVLEPGVPAILGDLPDGAATNRLGLARWLVANDNPLTARVTVNRQWQQFFGAGLVRTSENVGLQGSLPSHPELLDWLATEFVRREWDVKAMHRLIVTSATYRQQSTVTPDLVRQDEENRLLGRFPRRRRSARVLRDQALAASGLLVERFGGEPVKPYMPPRIWKSISNNAYQQDHGDALYRRSGYTYWRRTIPPPTMLTFNAADRETCIVRKDQTNTPLQALTLMNNVTFVEASRHLAERMLTEARDDVAAQLRYGFRLTTGREPHAAEAKVLATAHAEFLERYEHDTAAARELLAVGESKRDESLDPARHAAATMLASLLLNLDETIEQR